jgi:hypothetical protein
LRRDSQFSILVSHRPSALFRAILLIALVTQFTAVLHPGSRVSCHNFRSLCLCLSRILPESRYIAFARPRTENTVLLLVSADRTESISRGSYCCVRNITSKTSHVTPTE